MQFLRKIRGNVLCANKTCPAYKMVVETTLQDFKLIQKWWRFVRDRNKQLLILIQAVFENFIQAWVLTESPPYINSFSPFCHFVRKVKNNATDSMIKAEIQIK